MAGGPIPPLLVLLCAAPAAVLAQSAAPEITLVDTAVLTAPRLRESSGVASSRKAGVFWTHNDSGDGPLLYATDSAGSDLGFVTVSGAANLDWEDIARGPCFISEATCLYIADTGDNGSSRPYVTVYRLVEPEPPAGPGDTARVVPLLDAIVLRYPDRARDAEALAITRDGWLFLTAKDRTGPARLFRARIGEAVSASAPPAVLEPVGALAIETSLLRGRVVTAADISPDGRWLAVRTYVSLHFFRLNGQELPEPLLPPAGLRIPVVEAQGEGLAFDGDDRLVLTSESVGTRRAILTRLRIAGLPR